MYVSLSVALAVPFSRQYFCIPPVLLSPIVLGFSPLFHRLCQCRLPQRPTCYFVFCAALCAVLFCLRSYPFWFYSIRNHFCSLNYVLFCPRSVLFAICYICDLIYPQFVLLAINSLLDPLRRIPTIKEY